MLIKEMTCDDRKETSMDCKKCPFGSKDLFKVCMNFKKGQTMLDGLKKAYKDDLITFEKYTDIMSIMNINYYKYQERGK